MSTAIFEQFADGMRTLNTALTDAFAPDGTRCFLLKRSGETSQFTVVAELTAGFVVNFNEFRGSYLLEYADSDLSFRDKFAQTNFIAYGVPAEDGKMQVYKINDPQVDIVDPDASSPFWKAFCEKIRSERFTIPIPDP